MCLSLDQARALIDDFRGFYRSKTNVVDIPDRRLVIVGDLHGELDQALEVVRRYIGKYHVVFLGDYGDRGPQQVETFNLVMALAVLYPHEVTVLRGNHEAEEVAMRYGMYESVARTYSRDAFLYYCEAFSVLPVAARNRSGLFSSAVTGVCPRASRLSTSCSPSTVLPTTPTIPSCSSSYGMTHVRATSTSWPTSGEDKVDTSADSRLRSSERPLARR